MEPGMDANKQLKELLNEAFQRPRFTEIKYIVKDNLSRWEDLSFNVTHKWVTKFQELTQILADFRIILIPYKNCSLFGLWLKSITLPRLDGSKDTRNKYCVVEFGVDHIKIDEKYGISGEMEIGVTEVYNSKNGAANRIPNGMMTGYRIYKIVDNGC